jgi:hypothetical protein
MEEQGHAPVEVRSADGVRRRSTPGNGWGWASGSALRERGTAATANPKEATPFQGGPWGLPVTLCVLRCAVSVWARGSVAPRGATVQILPEICLVPPVTRPSPTTKHASTTAVYARACASTVAGYIQAETLCRIVHAV